MTPDEIAALRVRVEAVEKRLGGGSLISDLWNALTAERAAREKVEALIAECEKYLKPDETPRQRMDRDFREMQGLVDLLTKARVRAEKAEAERDANARQIDKLADALEKVEAALGIAIGNAARLVIRADDARNAALRKAAAVAENEGAYFAGLREGAILARVARNILSLIDKEPAT